MPMHRATKNREMGCRAGVEPTAATVTTDKRAHIITPAGVAAKWFSREIRAISMTPTMENTIRARGLECVFISNRY